MCLTLRGCTYYGAGVHITIGLLFLAGFFVDLLGIAEIWHNPYATYFTLILSLIYICLFIVFGLLIFRGTEKGSSSLLKGSIAGFVSLQISAFFVYLIILAITNSIRSSRRAAAEERLNLTANSNPNDLSQIEAILKDASEELKANSSIILSTLDKSANTPSPESEIDFALFDEEPIVSIYQVIVIVLGAVGTIAYTSVVVMFVKRVNEDEARMNSR